MDNPRKGRVEERHFLNLPGFNAGAYVLAYVQDTTDAAVRLPTRESRGSAPCPRLALEIADCDHRVNLSFDIEDADDRLNSFHKIDTLIAALEAFRIGLQEESALRRRRVRQIEEVRVALNQGEAHKATPAGLRAVS